LCIAPASVGAKAFDTLLSKDRVLSDEEVDF